MKPNIEVIGRTVHVHGTVTEDEPEAVAALNAALNSVGIGGMIFVDGLVITDCEFEGLAGDGITDDAPALQKYVDRFSRKGTAQTWRDRPPML